jgi:hypothetical protein
MKKLLFLLVVLVGVGCATQEEQARTNIQNTWRIDKVFENGQEVTSTYLNTRVNYRISFDGNNGFVEVYKQFAGGDDITVVGTWSFSDKATQLILADNAQSRVYQIDKLDEDELNITDQGSNNDRMIHFVPN